jgi:hypothetical protein
MVDADLSGGSPRDVRAGDPLSVPNPTVTSGSGSAPTEVSPHAALGVADLDRLIDALEDNVLRDLERRGGRYEGVF